MMLLKLRASFKLITTIIAISLISGISACSTRQTYITPAETYYGNNIGNNALIDLEIIYSSDEAVTTQKESKEKAINKKIKLRTSSKLAFELALEDALTQRGFVIIEAEPEQEADTKVKTEEEPSDNASIEIETASAETNSIEPKEAEDSQENAKFIIDVRQVSFVRTNGFWHGKKEMRVTLAASIGGQDIERSYTASYHAYNNEFSSSSEKMRIGGHALTMALNSLLSDTDLLERLKKS